MQSIQQWLLEIGYPNVSYDFTGKIKRFSIDGKSAKAGWSVGYKNSVGKKTNETLVIGDWTTGEKFIYSSMNGELKGEDREKVNRQIEKAKKDAEAERVTVQEATSAKSQLLFANASVGGGSEYLVRKNVGDNCTNGVHRYDGTTILVPCYDETGKIWGIQKIYENGEKRFQPGQRLKGTFCPLSDRAGKNHFILTEGYATGLTLNDLSASEPLACVLVCFNAQGLVEVGQIFKRLYPDCRLTYAADNDQWTELNGEKKNVGREKANEARDRTGGRVVCPQFADAFCGEKPTDWNDLFRLQGAAECHRQLHGGIQTEPTHVEERSDLPTREVPAGEVQIAEVAAVIAIEDNVIGDKENYVVCLGHSDSSYFYTSSTNKQLRVLQVSAHTAFGLADLMPADFWMALYPKRSKEGDVTGVNYGDAAMEMMAKARRSGIMSPDKVRGLGAWRDSGKLIFHLGDGLLVDGQKVDIHEFKSRSVYQLRSSMDYSDEGLNREEVRCLEEVCETISWQEKKSAILFLGWLACAPLGAALPWRPHMWLTGRRGSGKSEVIDKIIKKVLGNFAAYFAGETTAAGIRQKLNCDARPVIFDEPETEDERTAKKVGAVISMARDASSDNEASVSKGTPGGRSIDYQVRTCFLMASIRNPIVQDADRGRWTMLEIDSQKHSMEQFETFRKASNRLAKDQGFHLKFRKTVIDGYAVFLKNQEIFFSVLCDRFDARFGQQYGTLLAGYVSLVMGEVVSPEYASGLVAGLHLTDVFEEGAGKDEDDLLSYLLQKKIIDGDDGVCSVGRLISLPYKDETLKLYGLKLKAKDGKSYLQVAEKNPQLSDLFKGTRWAVNWTKSLYRIEGAERSSMKVNGMKANCIDIPIIPSELMED